MERRARSAGPHGRIRCRRVREAERLADVAPIVPARHRIAERLFFSENLLVQYRLDDHRQRIEHGPCQVGQCNCLGAAEEPVTGNTGTDYSRQEERINPVLECGDVSEERLDRQAEFCRRETYAQLDHQPAGRPGKHDFPAHLRKKRPPEREMMIRVQGATDADSSGQGRTS